MKIIQLLNFLLSFLSEYNNNGLGPYSSIPATLKSQGNSKI